MATTHKRTEIAVQRKQSNRADTSSAKRFGTKQIGLLSTALVAFTSLAAQAEDYNPHFGQIFLKDTSYLTSIGEVDKGGNATVAVLDGLVDTDHVDLSNVRAFQTPGGTYSGADLHGTHVAGIIAADDNGFGAQGVAADANILSYGVFDDTRWVANDVGALLRDAKSKGASIANASWGVSGALITSYTANEFASAGNGMLVVKAAGNEGFVSNDLFARNGNVLDNTLLVGSVDANNSISTFSNTPGEACITRAGCAEEDKVKNRFLVAPGEAVYSTIANDSYAALYGTSMAAPVVSGAAALLHSRWQWLKDDAKKTGDILLTTATDLGEQGVDAVYGHGLLNVEEALKAQGDVTIITDPVVTIPEETPVVTDPRAELRAALRACRSERNRRARRSCRRDARNDYRASRRDQRRLQSHRQNLRQNQRRASSIAQTHYKRSSLLNHRNLSGKQTVVFDKFGRDYAVDLATLGVAPERAKYTSVFAERRTAKRKRYSRRHFAFNQSGDVLANDQANPGLSFAFGVEKAGDDYAIEQLVEANETGHNPIASLVANGAYGETKFVAKNGVSFTAGFAQTSDWLDAESDNSEGSNRSAFFANTSVPLGESIKATLDFAGLREQGSLLGGETSGLFNLSEAANSQSMTVGLDMKLNDRFTALASYTLGRTNAGNTDGGLFIKEALKSSAFHLGVSANSLLAKNDGLSFALSQPLRTHSGTLGFGSYQVVDRTTGSLGFVEESIDASAQSRQLDLRLAYKRPILNDAGDIEVRAFRTLNQDHIAGENDTGVGARFSLRF